MNHGPKPVELSILLPLKARPLHTLRFLWHADRERMPYHFLIADGEAHPVITRLLAAPAVAFPNLDIEYRQYPDDVNLTCFFQKMADATARVRTPYVMQADNDDFLVPSGISHCVQFLKVNRDYASCGGGVGGFSLHASARTEPAHVVGPIENLYFRYNPFYLPHDFSAPSIAERIRQRFSGSYVLYYNVFHSDVLATISRELAEMDFSDLELHETYFGMRAKSLGKARLDGAVMSYMRQQGTSMSAEVRADWVSHLLHSRFTSDFDAMVRRIADVVAEGDGTDVAAFSEEVRELYGTRLRADLRLRFDPFHGRSAYHPINMIKAGMQRPALHWLLEAYRRLMARYRTSAIRTGVAMVRQRQRCLDDLYSFGATKEYVCHFDRELARIAETVAGADFMQFVRRHAAELLPPIAVLRRLNPSVVTA